MGFWGKVGDVIKTVAPVLGPVGGVASSIIDATSQRHANQANARMAERQMQFQAEQSSSQYQRGVSDMEKAGLNPGLAYQQGGDAAGSGSTATMQPTVSNTASRFATALGTYNEIASGIAQRDLIREQTNAAQADAHLKMVDASTRRPAAILGTDPEYVSRFITSERARATQRGQEAENYPFQFKANMANLNQNTATARATADNLRALTTLSEQQMQTEWFRKNIAPYLNATSATIKPFVPTFRFIP